MIGACWACCLSFIRLIVSHNQAVWARAAGSDWVKSAVDVSSSALYRITVSIRSDDTIRPNTNTLSGPLFGTEANTKRIFGTSLAVMPLGGYRERCSRGGHLCFSGKIVIIIREVAMTTHSWRTHINTDWSAYRVNIIGRCLGDVLRWGWSGCGLISRPASVSTTKKVVSTATVRRSRARNRSRLRGGV